MAEPSPVLTDVVVKPNLRHNTSPAKRTLAVNLWESDYAQLDTLAQASNMRVTDLARHAINNLLDAHFTGGQV